METADSISDQPRYCLGCYYNLHGLIEPRCPECGRRFDPDDSSSYSRDPHPERLRKFVKKTAITFADTLNLLLPPPAPADREAALSCKILELWRENTELKLRFEMMLTLLVRRGLIEPTDVDAILGDVSGRAAAAAMDIVDDGDEEPDPQPSLDLLILEQAARLRKRSDTPRLDESHEDEPPRS